MENPGSTVRAAVKSLIRKNPDVQRTVAAMRKRGLKNKYIEAEIGRAFLGCLWEQWKELPDRWLDVLRALENGQSNSRSPNPNVLGILVSNVPPIVEMPRNNTIIGFKKLHVFLAQF